MQNRDGRARASWLGSRCVGAVLAVWIAEALSLTDAGMPSGSFTLLLDGTPFTRVSEEIFKTSLWHAVTWQEARNRCLRRSAQHLGFSWFDLRGERTRPAGVTPFTFGNDDARFLGYTLKGFPPAVRDIASGHSIVNVNFDFRTPPFDRRRDAWVNDVYQHWNRQV
ncbi:hypothetical protein CMUS01_12597 [Colletotrichum musicola]|uniref:Uncharacterized protein n=1 Tax=Colletotrichum musicola TaxID=2175873 RepID=A0A8H6JKK2_9PEZI|nr:hypothetical protein CMUS01_12597 [Colletotrichum musicola]